MFKKVLFTLLALAAAATFSTAQTTSKSKSKDKIAEKEPKKNAHVKVRNATAINSPNLDFSPAFYQNGLVYVSSKRKNGPIDASLGETFFELYFAPFDPNQEPTSPSRFSMELNSAQHEGPVTFSADGNTIFFTRNNERKGVQKADKKGVIRMKIYEAERGAFDWQNVRELPFNADEYSCLHPTMSADGATLFFTSDMPGGFGGMDIWKTKKDKNGGWGRPENLGSAINSDKNEAFPFIHARGNLFFSSNRESSLGGLDIFLAQPDPNLAGHFDDVVNLGAPFNSKDDDLGFILDADGRRGFFASSRPGGYGKDDIYAFETSEIGISGVQKAMAQRAGLEVFDANSGAGLQGAAIRVFQREKGGYVLGDDFYEPKLVALSENGDELELRLVRKNDHELGQPDLFTNARGGALFDFLTEKDYLILVSKAGYKTTEMLFSPATGDLPKVMLEPLPACRPIQGMVKSEANGTPLSNAIVRFFDKKSTREELVRSNKDGLFDACLAINGDWMVMAEKQGFVGKTASIGLSGEGKIFQEMILPTAAAGQIVEETPMLGGKKLEIGSVITMDKIYYDFNQARLNADAVRQLKSLAAVMKRYPTLEIDLISHTDSKGSAAQNQKLSDERAQNAREYLVKACEISATRINAMGKGETQIKNRCADGIDCSDQEHAENRRTEIKIRKLAEGVRVEYQK